MNEFVPRDLSFSTPPEDIGEYKWLDANNDGTLELFITTTSGRRFFNDLWIFISDNGHKRFLQHEHVWELDDLKTAFGDFEGDGLYELIAQIYLAGDGGLARPMAIWTAVYRWNGSKFERADQLYKDFYVEKLPELESKIKSVEDEIAASYMYENPDKWVLESRQNNEHHLACVRILRDKILRTIGRDSNAGFQKALEWSRSDDKQMRIYAVFLFGDIFDKESRKQLEAMMKDRDESIANWARLALENGLKLQKK